MDSFEHPQHFWTSPKGNGWSTLGGLLLFNFEGSWPPPAGYSKFTSWKWATGVAGIGLPSHDY
jgi:hypothetical protein